MPGAAAGNKLSATQDEEAPSGDGFTTVVDIGC